MGNLTRTAVILDIIENAAKEGALPGPTGSFLAQYLAIVLYAEMEEQIMEILREHLETFTHESVATFVCTSMSDLIKRTPKSDIAKLTARFGDQFKTTFNEAIEERTVSKYSNIINARHEIGHKKGSNITISEVREGHMAANQILNALSACLSRDQSA